MGTGAEVVPKAPPRPTTASKSNQKCAQIVTETIKMSSKAYSNRQISCSDWHPQVHQGHKHAHANRGRGGQYEDTPKAVAASKNQAIGKQTDRQTTTRQQQIKKTKNTEKVQRPHHVRSTGAAVYRLACSIDQGMGVAAPHQKRISVRTYLR